MSCNISAFTIANILFQKFVHFNVDVFFTLFVILRPLTYYQLFLFTVRQCFTTQKNFNSWVAGAFISKFMSCFITIFRPTLQSFQIKFTACMVSEFFCILKPELVNSATVKCVDVRPRLARLWTPALCLLAVCPWLCVFVPRLPHLQNGDYNSTSILGLMLSIHLEDKMRKALRTVLGRLYLQCCIPNIKI